MVPKGPAKGQHFGHSTCLSSCFSAEPCFGREGGTYVKRPATGGFVEKEVVQEGVEFDRRLQELQGVIWQFQRQLTELVALVDVRQSGLSLPSVSPIFGVINPVFPGSVDLE